MESEHPTASMTHSEITDTDPEETPDEVNRVDRGNLLGVVAALGNLKEGTVVFEEGLARLFDRHPASIRRAVARGELPPPIRLLGRNAWTVGALLRHFEIRLEQAAKERERLAQRIARLTP